MRWRTIGVAAGIAGTMAGMGGLLAAWFTSDARMMAPMLAQAEGQSTCFAGTFTGQTLDVENWSRAKLVPTERLSPDGKPYMRNVPPVEKDKTVRSFTLQLTYDSRSADYDWIYNFRLAAEVDGIGTLYAAGECPWYTGKKPDPDLPYTRYGNTGSIGCYIDCDGGGFDVDRVPGAPALWLSFNATHGLRMSAGCGGRGTHRVKSAAAVTVFRVQQASAETCRPLEEMAAR
jgi:hypothetical protein